MAKKKRTVSKPRKIRLKTFSAERKKIRKLIKEEKSIYPRKLRVSQEDVQKREQIKKLKGEVRAKQFKEARKVTAEAAARISSMAASKLKERAISRRVLKRNRATVVVREHKPAPYIPIFFDKGGKEIKKDTRQFYFK